MTRSLASTEDDSDDDKRGSSCQLVTRVGPVGRRPSSTKRRGNVLVLMLVVVAAVESVAAAPMILLHAAALRGGRQRGCVPPRPPIRVHEARGPERQHTATREHDGANMRTRESVFSRALLLLCMEEFIVELFRAGCLWCWGGGCCPQLEDSKNKRGESKIQF